MNEKDLGIIHAHQQNIKDSEKHLVATICVMILRQNDPRLSKLIGEYLESWTSVCVPALSQPGNNVLVTHKLDNLVARPTRNYKKLIFPYYFEASNDELCWQNLETKANGSLPLKTAFSSWVIEDICIWKAQENHTHDIALMDHVANLQFQPEERDYQFSLLPPFICQQDEINQAINVWELSTSSTILEHNLCSLTFKEQKFATNLYRDGKFLYCIEKKSDPEMMYIIDRYDTSALHEKPVTHEVSAEMIGNIEQIWQGLLFCYSGPASLVVF